jgi:hypothetical protein
MSLRDSPAIEYWIKMTFGILEPGGKGTWPLVPAVPELTVRESYLGLLSSVIL